jgi:hypothetical protein
MKTYVHLWQYLTKFFLEWETFQTKAVEKIETHILCTVTFFSENHVIVEITWKNMVEPYKLQMTIIRHRNDVLCMLDN